jgi:hypothetical protein
MRLLRPRAHDTALAALVEVQLDEVALEMIGGTNTRWASTLVW